MFFKKKYNYVPPCPRCGSLRTGYIIRCVTEKECNEARYRGILNGELVEAEIGFDFGDIDNNIFCLDCGSTYFGQVEKKRLSFEEICEQKELRGINEEMIEAYAQVCSSNFSKRQAIKSLQREREKLEKKQAKKKNETVIKQGNKKVRVKTK